MFEKKPVVMLALGTLALSALVLSVSPVANASFGDVPNLAPQQFASSPVQLDPVGTGWETACGFLHCGCPYLY
jgi:hypothetical protein